VPVALNSELPGTCPGVLARLSWLKLTSSLDSLNRELSDALLSSLPGRPN
jgi:hypothetical protein